jgi:hypothetical protein
MKGGSGFIHELKNKTAKNKTKYKFFIITNFYIQLSLKTSKTTELTMILPATKIKKPKKI